MNDHERETLAHRYWQAEKKMRAIHAGNVVDGNPVGIEGKLVVEQDGIEFLLGADYFEQRNRMREHDMPIATGEVFR